MVLFYAIALPHGCKNMMISQWLTKCRCSWGPNVLMHFEFPSALQPQNLKGFIGGLMEVHYVIQMSGECGGRRGWWWVVGWWRRFWKQSGSECFYCFLNQKSAHLWVGRESWVRESAFSFCLKTGTVFIVHTGASTLVLASKETLELK